MTYSITFNESGGAFIPLPHEARQAILLELLQADYKTLNHDIEQVMLYIHNNPKAHFAKEDLCDILEYQKAIKTVIDYHGGSIDE